jgi:hypothetical protein
MQNNDILAKKLDNCECSILHNRDMCDKGLARNTNDYGTAIGVVHLNLLTHNPPPDC